MARTGVNIQVNNTTFSGVPKVNENSMIFYLGVEIVGTTEDFSDVYFAPPSAYTSFEQFSEAMGAGADSLKELMRQVEAYFQPTPNVNNNGKLLWVSQGECQLLNDGSGDFNLSTNGLATAIVDAVAGTVANGFENRPRQLIFVFDENIFGLGSDPYQSIDRAYVDEIYAGITEAITQLYREGFSVVAIAPTIHAAFGVSIDDQNNMIVPDLAELKSPFLAICAVSTEIKPHADVARAAGYLITKSVGTSIGDTSAESFASKMYLITYNGETLGEYKEAIDVSFLDAEVVNELGDNQFLFTRTRPPRNGLWWNDGATCADPSTGLSTLEAGRTIASIVDDLREFFTSYINTKVPVADNGDIQSTYKQVVLDAAFSQVIQPYIDSGDISNARIELKAVNNNMVESRTWEVKLSILPAPTLRWVDAYVFYVKTLE